MITLAISEILEKINKIEDKEERIRKLQENSSPTMKAILGCTYDPDIKFDLPEGKPPYKATVKEMDLQGVLYKEVRKLPYFLTNSNLPKFKKEMLFIQMLESIDPDDANLILHMKDKKLPYENITKHTVKKAFPGISKHW